MYPLIYDIEIIKAIPDKNNVKLDGIEYCEGWDDHANMGISVIGAYDYAEQRYRVFCEDNIREFYDILSQRILVGFNNKGFDDKVIACRFPDEYKNEFFSLPRYDILQEIWIAAGLEPTFKYPSHAGFGLDATCSVNFNTNKTGNGALAPVLWQQGRVGTVIDYCLNDVSLTKQCFDAIIHTGELLNPKNPGEILKIRMPDEIAIVSEIK